MYLTLSLRFRVVVLLVLCVTVYILLSQRLKRVVTGNPEYFHLKTSHSRLLPYEYWEHRNLHPEYYTSETCTSLPLKSEIHYGAPHWQRMKIVNGSVYLYGAFWDNRFVEPLVRVLVYVDVDPIPEMLYLCTLLYAHEAAPHVVKAEVQYAWRKEWGGPKNGVNEPYVVSCRATFHHHHPHEYEAPPLAVSLVQDPCERASNILNVQNNQVAKKKEKSSEVRVAACLKWLDYEDDVSAELVEWLQLLKYFGAEMVYVYLIRAHSNVHRVLEHYSSENFIDVTELSHPPWLTAASKEPGGKPEWGSGARNFHDYRRELLPLNDCLYRSQGTYDWLAVFDMDEIIVPVTDKTWQHLIARETASKSPDALTCRNYYYLDEAQRDQAAPKFAKKLAHEWRAKEPSAYGRQVKSFHKTSTVVAMHNHTPMSCGARTCEVMYAKVSDARLQHYRARCSGSPTSEECQALLNDTVRDQSLQPYRDRLLTDIPMVLTALDIPLPE